jgi:hypothetical protein
MPPATAPSDLAVMPAATGPAAYRFPTRDRTDRRSGPGASRARWPSRMPRSPQPRPPARTSHPARPPRARSGRSCPRSPAGAAPRNPESRVSDRQLRDDVIALAHLMKDSRAERRFVERDGLSGPVNPQLRLDARHGGQLNHLPAECLSRRPWRGLSADSQAKVGHTP